MILLLVDKNGHELHDTHIAGRFNTYAQSFFPFWLKFSIMLL